ncbi:hypothetical protein [Profundibacter amoris]|nr:hypothetical protein [Profundibacter amoris]
MRAELISSWGILECLKALENPDEGWRASSARHKLQFNANQQFMKAFFLSAFSMRKMDEAANHPWPAGKTLERKHDRQLDKRLKDFNFDTYVGKEETLKNGSKEFSIEDDQSKDGREITNLSIHSAALRFFDQPFDEAGFWIQSDRVPEKQDKTKFVFVEFEQYCEMLDCFIQEPQE